MLLVSIKSKMTYSSIIPLLISFILINGQSDYPKVETPLGQIRGYYKRSEKNKTYKVFEGIPFARPPVNSLRFKDPQKILPWVGELQATKLADGCVYFSPLVPEGVDRVGGSEDCLYLNVYVPIKDSPIPVIIWIYGGAFQFGAGSDYGVKYLIDTNIIFVTFNYRLGSLGFLSTEDEIVSGNMGLKDQNMALLWVNKYIMYFGGDPNKITLVGQSAGGASVHYHYLSPLSAGLFQSGISMSGTALAVWAQTEKSLEKAQKLGALMGCPTEKTEDMVECLRSRSAKSIMEATTQFLPWLNNPYTPFGPVVEKSRSNYFINRSPIDVIVNGDAYDVPWINGVVSEEGLYPAAEFITNSTRLNDINENWDQIATYLLDYNNTIPQEQHAQIARRIRQHYMKSKPINKSNIESLIRLISDRIYVSTSEKAARLQAKYNRSPLWYYYYSFRASGSFSEALSGSRRNFGVSHSDDAFLVFEQSLIKYRNTARDRAMRQFIMDYWASVAESRNPGIEEWSPVKPWRNVLNYLHIYGPKKLQMESNSLGNNKFWNTINFDENRYTINLNY